jgi:DNA replication protein DnaC
MNRKTTPRVDLDVTRQRLERLGMVHAAERIEGLISEAVKNDTAPHLLIDQLLDAELERREERRLQTSLRLSGLPTGQTLGNFDFSFQPSVERARIETLGTCQWIREKRTLLIQGPPGVGKTHCENQLPLV